MPIHENKAFFPNMLADDCLQFRHYIYSPGPKNIKYSLFDLIYGNKIQRRRGKMKS